jgi:hypothetical protein
MAVYGRIREDVHNELSLLESGLHCSVCACASRIDITYHAANQRVNFERFVAQKYRRPFPTMFEDWKRSWAEAWREIRAGLSHLSMPDLDKQPLAQCHRWLRMWVSISGAAMDAKLRMKG